MREQPSHVSSRDVVHSARTHAAHTVFMLTGPRQSGKTTLVRHLIPGHTYCNLEHPELRTLAADDPKGFFSRHPGPAFHPDEQAL